MIQWAKGSTVWVSCLDEIGPVLSSEPIGSGRSMGLHALACRRDLELVIN